MIVYFTDDAQGRYNYSGSWEKGKRSGEHFFFGKTGSGQFIFSRHCVFLGHGLVFLKNDSFKRQYLFHIHIPIWQHGSCIHLAMATKPHPILINSLHPNNAIQLTLYLMIEKDLKSCFSL